MVLARVLLLRRDTMRPQLLLRKHFIEVGLPFRGLIHYHHGRKRGSVQADVVLEKKLRVLHLDP